jgi:hypothetical protein
VIHVLSKMFRDEGERPAERLALFSFALKIEALAGCCVLFSPDVQPLFDKHI